MSFQGKKSSHAAMLAADRADALLQYSALCYRTRRDTIEVLLITSRTTRRWIVPKGWPMPDRTPAEAALREAYEEAGVQGVADDRCIGAFSYLKTTKDDLIVPCVAMVFPVKVKKLAAKFPERKERRRAWFSRKKAASLVQEPELAELLRGFDPRKLR
ncbi:NUDIX hydrolase [Pseudooceanicola nanhaiensis]|uniref:NUDIX hydrolase n=1 Tax=Pseudooceanicola nanhaiensis TaxID=375761 RepID=UPI001CD5ED94|nr:NUDIX hydrolase [Pseudooceanicola nanhaiensis]MCA0921154.1 NUDIX hydrolase [Pseudooceanicola nanhaiensis]